MARINVPPLTRALLALLFTFSSLNFAFRYRQWAPSDHTGSFHSSLYNVPYLTIVPNQSIKYPWTEATAFFVEENIFSFVASGLTLFYGGRYLERAWGSSEFAKFVAFVTAIPNLFTFFVYAVWYSVTRNANVGYVRRQLLYGRKQTYTLLLAPLRSTAPSPSKPPSLSHSSNSSPSIPSLSSVPLSVSG